MLKWDKQLLGIIIGQKKKKKNETDFIEFCANGKGEVQIVREI